jgi:hypothetical protein
MNSNNKAQITPKDKIFSTGVHLQAVEVKIGEIKQWRWLVVGFEEESYFNGETIDLNDYADSFEGLVKDSE